MRTKSKWLSCFIDIALTEILLLHNQVAAEIHQRLLEEEKENQPAETKEKSPQMSANKKAKKEQAKKKKEDKKEKGIDGVSIQNHGCLKLSLVENQHFTKHTTKALGLAPLFIRLNVAIQTSVNYGVSWQIISHASPA